MSQSAGEYFIGAFGRNGEIVRDRAFVLEIKHLDFTNTRTLSLKTGQDGRIELMPAEIEWVRARYPDRRTYNWPIARDPLSGTPQPTAIHATTDEMIEVAVPGEPDNADKPSVFSLLSKRKGFYERDYASAGTIQGGYLYLRGLAPGDYELFSQAHPSNDHPPHNRGQTGQRVRPVQEPDSRRQPAQPHPNPSRCHRNGKGRSLLETRANSPAFTPMHPVPLELGYLFRLGRGRGSLALLDELGEQTFPLRQGTGNWRGIPLRARPQVCRQVPWATCSSAPALILNPWSVRKTDTGRQKCRPRGDYERKMDQAGESKSGKRGLRSSESGGESDYADLDFLEQNALLWANVKPDEKGIASIDLKGLSGHQRLHVFAVDAWNVAYRPVSLPSAELKRKELRMVRELAPDKPFSEQKLFTSLAKGKRFKLAGVTTSKVQAYDSLARAYGCFPP